MSTSTFIIEQTILGQLIGGGDRFMRLNLSAIARQAGVNQSTVSRMVKSMIENGVIEMKRPGWYRRRMMEGGSVSMVGDLELIQVIIDQQRSLDARMSRIEVMLTTILQGHASQPSSILIQEAPVMSVKEEKGRGVESGTERFEEWWLAYPKKKKRQDTLKKWKSRKLDSIADRLIEDVRLRLQTRAWKEGYIPDPTTYINGSRWEDEVDTEIQSPLHNSLVMTHSDSDKRVAEEMVKEFGPRSVNAAAQGLIRQGLSPLPGRVLKFLRENHSETRSHDSRDDSAIEDIARKIGLEFDFPDDRPGVSQGGNTTIDAEWWDAATGNT